MSTSTGGRASYHHGDLHKALLDAAEQLLDENAEDPLALRAVARRAGVSHAAAYNHFEGRVALLRAVALRAFARLQTLLEQLTGDPSTGLGDVAAAYVRFAMEHPAQFRLMFDRTLCRTDGSPDELGAAGEAAQAALDAFLRERFALEDVDVARAGLAAWAQMHGIAALVLDTPALKGITVSEAEGLARESAGLLALGRRPGTAS